MGKHLTEDVIDSVLNLISPYMDKHKTYRQVSKALGIDTSVIERVVKRKNLEDRFATGKEAKKLNTIDTWIEKYGSLENYRIALNKSIELSNMEKYGVKHNSKIECVVEKRSKTMKDKSAEEKAMIQDKRNITLSSRFGGVDEFWKYQKAASENTKLLKYGDKHFTNPEKIKSTVQSKYGVDNVFQLDSVKDKSKETCIEKYGVEYFSQSDVSKDRICKTNQEKYGVPYYIQSDEFRDKLKKSCIEKYGVEWYVLTSDCIQSRLIKNDSKPNREFSYKLHDNNIPHEREFRLGRFIYDFKVGNTLVEINPFPTHNIDFGIFGTPLQIDYHKIKTDEAALQGYSVMHVWDWDDVNKVIALLNTNRTKIGARNCTVTEIDYKIANEFLDAYHLQNSCKGNTVNIALLWNDIVVSVMTFGKPRYNKNYEWELLRYCNNLSYIVIGSAEKLFSYFVKNYCPKSIISYCDRSKFTGLVYDRLGFSLIKRSPPSIHWFDGKRHITDNLLRQRGFDQLFGTDYGKGTSNEELMLKHKFVRVPDCGQDTYVIEYEM